jgi:DNA-binding NarL/FixJ family response regulator
VLAAGGGARLTTAMRPLPVLVCDDRPARLQKLVARLRSARGLVLVDTPASGEEPVLQVRRLQPRLVIFGVTSTSLASFAVLRRQADAAAFVAVIETEGLQAAAMAAGADRVLLASREDAELDGALRQLLGPEWPGLDG